MAHVIVGAGFAGLATAYHLARRGLRDLVVLEQAEGPGMYASGRNAGLLRQSSDDGPTAAMLQQGARAARKLLAGVPGALQETGSLILGDAIRRLRAGKRAKVLDAAELVPGLRGAALYDPDDAILDPLALLHRYEDGARRRGVTVRYSERLTGIETRGGAVRAVATSRGELAASSVIVAAGPWAGTVAALAGSDAIPIEPRRRHLFRGRLSGADAHSWPFVWHETDGVYFRPEGDGMLLSPCDVEPHPPAEPAFEPGARDVLAARLEATFGALGDWSIGPGWPCLRTFTGDHRFLIGPDPGVGGLFWVAALGGHGVTSSWAVGRLASEVFLGRLDPGPFAPSRFGG